MITEDTDKKEGIANFEFTIKKIEKKSKQNKIFGSYEKGKIALISSPSSCPKLKAGDRIRVLEGTIKKKDDYLEIHSESLKKIEDQDKIFAGDLTYFENLEKDHELDEQDLD